MSKRIIPMKFGAVAKIFHWLIAIILTLMFMLGFGVVGPGLEHMEGAEKVDGLTAHTSAGLIILVLAVLRLLWRWTHPVPAYPITMPGWQKTASKWNVRLLYTLLIVQPLLGIAQAATYMEFDIMPFRAINLTALAPSSEAATQLFHVLHEAVGLLLALAIAIHVLAAMKHLLIDRDRVFQRMWPFARV